MEGTGEVPMQRGQPGLVSVVGEEGADPGIEHTSGEEPAEDDELLQDLEQLREIAYLVQDAPRKARRRVLVIFRRFAVLEAEALSPAAAALLAEIQLCSMSWV